MGKLIVIFVLCVTLYYKAEEFVCLDERANLRNYWIDFKNSLGLRFPQSLDETQPSIVAPPPSVSKQYRTDYEYNSKTDAFYKLHIDAQRRWKISDICTMEGAQLMIPESDNDIKQLHAMFKKFPDLGEYVWVEEDGKTYESAEEQPIIDLGVMTTDDVVNYGCDVVSRTGYIKSASCFQELPFICKVAAKDAPYNKHCDVYGSGYDYYSSVGSCYKIPQIAYTWPQAYSECQAEGSHLLVLNSLAEHDAIFNFTNMDHAVLRATVSYFFLAGFRADKPKGNATAVFKTIFNQTLEEAGYNDWSPNEPNNAFGREYCGCIFKNDGKLNDIDCTREFGFICEKEVPS